MENLLFLMIIEHWIKLFILREKRLVLNAEFHFKLLQINLISSAFTQVQRKTSSKVEL